MNSFNFVEKWCPMQTLKLNSWWLKPDEVKCPKCGSNDLTIAVADNGFGTYKCNKCNHSGSYPP